MSGVSVIIVTCGVRGFLRACLDSVHRQSSPVREVIVIDNSLDPGLRARLGDCLSGVNLVSNARNQPYGVSLNQGIRISSGEFILCLNDDVTLEPGYVGEALKGFSAGGRVGMVSGKILRPDRKTIDSTGLFLTMYRTAKERGYGLPDLGQYQSAGPVFGVSGAAAFYRRSMLFDVADRGGFFDPDFGMFYEDLDIAWRAHRRGWKGYYTPRAVACHERGGSCRPEGAAGKPFGRNHLDDQLLLSLIMNRRRALRKNMSPSESVRCALPIFFYDCFALSHLLLFRPGALKLLLNRKGTVPA